MKQECQPLQRAFTVYINNAASSSLSAFLKRLQKLKMEAKENKKLSFKITTTNTSLFCC
jgi:hypothetical protein